MKKKLSVLFLSLLLFASYTTATANEMEDATVFYNEAIDLYRQSDVEKSIELFQKATQINPNFYEAHYNLAQILMSINKNDEAMKSLEKIIQLRPNDSETLYNLGRIEYKKGFLSKAYSYLKRVDERSAQFESAKLLIEKIEKRQSELNLETKISEHKIVKDEQEKHIGVELDEIKAPSGVALDSRGNIFSASFAENAIYKISIYGQKTIFSKSSLIQGPIGLAIDKENNVYIASYNSNSIIKITQDGVASVFATVQKPYCLTYDSLRNRLYVTEQNTNKLVKFDL